MYTSLKIPISRQHGCSNNIWIKRADISTTIQFIQKFTSIWNSGLCGLHCLRNITVVSNGRWYWFIKVSRIANASRATISDNVKTKLIQIGLQTTERIYPGLKVNTDHAKCISITTHLTRKLTSCRSISWQLQNLAQDLSWSMVSPDMKKELVIYSPQCPKIFSIRSAEVTILLGTSFKVNLSKKHAKNYKIEVKVDAAREKKQNILKTQEYKSCWTWQQNPSDTILNLCIKYQDQTANTAGHKSRKGSNTLFWEGEGTATLQS